MAFETVTRPAGGFAGFGKAPNLSTERRHHRRVVARLRAAARGEVDLDRGAPGQGRRREQEVVQLRGRASGPRLLATSAKALGIQGGSIESGLLLESGSRATASGTRLNSIELTDGSVLETRGRVGPKATGRAEER